MSEFNPLEPFTDAITEVANKTYDDTLHPSLNATGKSLSLIPRAINAALSPLEAWILKKEYNIAETKKLLEIKLANVSPEKIVPPEPYVAVPTIQALSYCMDCEELRDLFASLLASSMNSDKKDDVHPSFVEIIKNMSPLDARIIKYITKNNKDNIPIVNYRFSKPGFYENSKFLRNKKVIDIIDHIISIDDIETNPVNISASNHNLERLGLIDINYNFSISDSNYYKQFENNEIYNEYLNYKNTTSGFEDFDIEIIKGILKFTSYGLLFSSVTT